MGKYIVIATWPQGPWATLNARVLLTMQEEQTAANDAHNE
jgi:hypothetical protein